MFYTDSEAAIANAVGDRFGLDDAARTAVRLLFTSSSTGERSISWMALFVSLLSAFSLSRRLSRVYASIFGVPPLRPSRTWRGFIWIVLQVSLFISASFVRDVRRDEGVLLTIVMTLVLIGVWFLADMGGLLLLVPSVPRRLMAAAALTSSLGRIGIGVWASVYMPKSLAMQAAQFGPIGVTFSIFTYLLAGTLVYLGGPLLVTTWVAWREGRVAPSIPDPS
jgi:membrane protein